MERDLSRDVAGEPLLKLDKITVEEADVAWRAFQLYAGFLRAGSGPGSAGSPEDLARAEDFIAKIGDPNGYSRELHAHPQQPQI